MELRDDTEVLSAIMQQLEVFYGDLPRIRKLAAILGTCEKLLYGVMNTTLNVLSDEETRSERTQSLLEIHIRGLRENFKDDLSHAILSAISTPLDKMPKPKHTPQQLEYANKILKEALDSYNKNHGGK